MACRESQTSVEAMAVGVESSQRCGQRLFKLERLQSTHFNSGIQK